MARSISHSKNISVAADKPKLLFKRGDLPTRDMLIAYLKDNPSHTSKRDAAKAFGIKGTQRIALKALLKQLQAEGILNKKSSKITVIDAIPSVAVLDVFTRDHDGLLIGKLLDWDDNNGVPPKITLKIGGKTAGVGTRVLAKISRDDEGNYLGHVIKTLEKQKKLILGVLRKLPNRSFKVMPIERRGNEFTVDEHQLNGALDGDLVEIEPVKIGRFEPHKAKIVSVAGNVKSEKAVSLIAVHVHDIAHVFSQEALSEASSAKPASLLNREDWRDVPLITIDPFDAKDHDDAVYAIPDPNLNNEGGHIITVAIADVAYYVNPQSALDKEAYKRGNSTYFPDRVVPMLPERISNELCSLIENEDRPAIAVKMIITKNGEKLSHTFHRIMMRSFAKLSYQEAQGLLDGRVDSKIAHLHESILKPLYNAYVSLSIARNARNTLELDLPERKILLHPDGSVDKIITPERLDTHKLVEEMMILANVASAQTLESKSQKLIYRVHDQPSLSKQESLRLFLKTLDLPLAKSGQICPKDFNYILSKVRGTVNEALTNEVVLRSQSQANYSPDNIGHFGLNLPKYAHFTSPIRRYADLIVHRALIKACGLGDDGITQAQEENLKNIAEQISGLERRSMAAERDTIERLIANHLKDHIGDIFEGRISGVVGAGLFITLPAFGADGFAPVSTLQHDYYHYSEANHALIGEKSGLGYRLGDSVEVKLTDVQIYAGSIKYQVITAPQKMPINLQSFHKSKKVFKGNRRRQ
jgi:ribonuclease R